jgi:general secretion pathway protein I
MRQRGFTLLEVLVASVIMGIAVVGLLSALSASMRNAARLAEYDRVQMVARARMDSILVESRWPKFAVTEGVIDPILLGGAQGGWRARITPFEAPPNLVANTLVLDRVELEIWWMAEGRRRSFSLEAFRRSVVRPEDLAGMASGAR